jgi:ribonuclease-3
VDNEIFGYNFQNASLLEEALTTPSYKMEHPKAHDNQRLEFLGDAVLGLLAADYLYQKHSDRNEGDLTIARTRMVSSEALCKAASANDLLGRLRLNTKVEPPPQGSKTYADAIEAIIGAAWLDGGFPAAKIVFDALKLEEGGVQENPKGDLQIKAQAMVPPRRPVYELVSVSGKAHEPTFTVKVFIDGVGETVASASSRKAAEVLAAKQLLSLCS